MKSLMNELKQSCGESGINLAKLAVIAAFFTLLGDFLAFIAAILTLQQEDSNDNRKKEIKQQIDSLYKELDKISKSL